MSAIRPLWIATCALAVIGAFFVVLQAAWMVKIEPEWLTYPAQLVGAALAGLVVSRMTGSSSRAAFVAGVAAVGLLTLVSYALPNAFTLTAERSMHAPIIVPVLAVGSGIACVLGARVANASGRSLPIATAFVAACAIELGGRLAYIAGLPARPAPLAIFAMAAAFVVGLTMRALVRRACGREVASGVLVLMLWMIVVQLVSNSSQAITIWDLMLVIGAPISSAVGTRVAFSTSCASTQK